MNTIRDYLNADILLNTARMCLIDKSKLVLVVEGQDDKLVLEEHASENLLVVPATAGRQQVVEAAKKSNGELQSDRIRFVIDRDYADHKTTKEELTSNVFVSELHDLFMDLIAADTHLIEKVVTVHSASASRRPKQSNPIPQASHFISQALDLARCLSTFRVVDARHSLNIDFKRFSFFKLNKSNCTPSDVASIVMEKCQYPGNDGKELILESEKIFETISSGDCPYADIGDHDFFSALSRVMALHGIKIKHSDLQKSFIAAITCTAFRNIPLYKDVTAWAATYKVVVFTCPN